MKPLTLIGCCLVAAAAALSPARAGADGHVNFFLGQKSLDSDDWAPIDDQFEFGAVMSFGADDWPVHIAADVLTSVGEEDVYDPFIGPVRITGSTIELDAGVRKIWKKGNVLPYLGAGIGIVTAALEVDNGFATVDAADAGLGLWAGTGVFFRLGGAFNLGLDVRYSSAEVDLDFGDGVVVRDVGAGGFHYGLLLGFGW